MDIQYVVRPPQSVQMFPKTDDPALHFRPEDVQRIVEIFQTPLSGAYNWDYASVDQKIQRLYGLGKQLNWNAATDIDWSRTFDRLAHPIDRELSPMVGFEPFERMSDAECLEFSWHHYTWTLSQFMHGEQGALLVASQLVSCAPTYDAKAYAASQTFDEARHVEAFSRYLREKIGFMYPISLHLKMLMDKVLTDPRWDLKFIGMQIIIEGLALAAFNTLEQLSNDPLFCDIIARVKGDESRHVAFGVLYMESFVKSLPESEIETRARFAYEACVVMRERLVPLQVFEHFGWDVEAARHWFLASEAMDMFRKLLFTRIIPNLKRVGLLTESVRPLYDELGILEFENLVDDGVIDWVALGGSVQEIAI